MIRVLREYYLGERIEQIRSVPVSMGEGREKAVLFIHANTGNLDPWSEAMRFPKDTLKLSLFTESGRQLWRRDLGPGIIPGLWFAPFISFDLDGDGVDEIWGVGNNKPMIPFTCEHRVLECIDPLTNTVTGTWPWPNNMKGLSMSLAYRFMLAAGYAHGEPVLICAQGTYTHMHLQAYNKGMELRWQVDIAEEEPGARASHVFPVFDINGDGVDELFWGERVISLDDGHEVFCCDRDSFRGHSDVIAPFIDPETNKIYIYTCRENDARPGVKRVVCYDDKGNAVWRKVDAGHMHKGWVASIGENRRKVAMAMSLALDAHGYGAHSSTPILYYFDAVTGQEVPWTLPYPGSTLLPVDFNGDGYHEFYGTEGAAKGKIIDRFGNELADVGASLRVRSGKVIDHFGQQLMLAYPEECKIRVWGDDEASDGPCETFREYHFFMQHLMASGYNQFRSSGL